MAEISRISFPLCFPSLDSCSCRRGQAPELAGALLLQTRSEAWASQPHHHGGLTSSPQPLGTYRHTQADRTSHGWTPGERPVVSLNVERQNPCPHLWPLLLAESLWWQMGQEQVTGTGKCVSSLAVHFTYIRLGPPLPVQCACFVPLAHLGAQAVTFKRRVSGSACSRPRATPSSC